MTSLPHLFFCWLLLIPVGLWALAGRAQAAPEQETTATQASSDTESSAPERRGFRIQPREDRSSVIIRHSDFPNGQWILLLPEYIYPDEETDQEARQVRWESNAEQTHLTFHWNAPEELKKSTGLDFRGELTAYERTLDFSLTGKNVGSELWDQWRLALICLQSGGVPIFHDYYAHRTFAHQEGEFVSIHDIIEGKFADHRMTGVSQVSRLAAKISEDGKWVLGLAVDTAQGLSFNFQNRMSCIHSNPSWAQPQPGEETTSRGKIYLLRGSLQDLWQAYQRDFEED